MNDHLDGIDFCRRPSLVASVTAGSYETTVRLFVPLQGLEDRRVAWSQACAVAGIELSGQTAWRDVRDRLPVGWDAEPEAGSVDQSTADALIDTFGPDQTVVAVYWGVYADPPPTTTAEMIVLPSTGTTRWHDGSHFAQRTTLGELTKATAEQMRRWPVCVLPESEEFVIACPGYSDSLYLSCSQQAVDQLSAAGLDLRAVDRSDSFATGSWD